MGWSTPDPYYQPEEFGLEIIFQGDRSTQCYEFDTFVAWRHTDTGNLYYATSSGCSCPSPFEEYRKLADLSGPVTVNQLAHAALKWCAECWSGTAGDHAEFISMVNAWRIKESGIPYSEAA